MLVERDRSIMSELHVKQDIFILSHNELSNVVIITFRIIALRHETSDISIDRHVKI